MRHAPNRNTTGTLLAMLLLTSAGTAVAQTSVQQAMLRAASSAPTAEAVMVAPPISVAAALQQVSVQAAVVFTGSVAMVRPDVSGSARITFQVERGIRGVASGAEYNVRISAWAGGADRYVPGERALFLLTAPSVSGFSSPVMGERGIVPLSGDALAGNVDLRWIAADVQRGDRFPASTVQAAPAVHASTVFASPASAPRETSSEFTPAATSLSLPDVHAIDRDLVLDLLRVTPLAREAARS